jgi:hypothetical protein
MEREKLFTGTDEFVLKVQTHTCQQHPIAIYYFPFFRIRDILVRIRILLFLSRTFKTPTKKKFFIYFLRFFSLLGTFTVQLKSRIQVFFTVFA